jgi:hypothetical protein
VAGSYDDTNALANITIAGWSQDLGRAACTAVDIIAGGESVDSDSVQITSSNGTVYITGLEVVSKAFDRDLSITFL